MERGKRKTVLIIQKVVLAIILLFIVLILIGTVYECGNTIFTDIFNPVFTLLLLILFSVSICLILLFFYRLIDRWGKRRLILASVILFAVMTVIFVILFFNFRCVPYTDALNVQDTALYFAQTGSHEISDASGHYAYYQAYGNNNVLTILLSYFYKVLLQFGISDVVLPSSILSAIGIMIAALFTYLAGVKIGGLKKGVKVLLLCVMNPLYYLLAFWAYSEVISIPFMMAVLYFGICTWKAKNESRRILNLILMMGAAVFGYFIRATVLIPLIAVCCCALLLLITGARKFIRKFYKGILAGVLTSVLIFAGLETLNNSYFSSVAEENFPVTHWLMMGSHGAGRHNDADVEFTKSFDTKQERQKETLQKTIENYQNFSIPELAGFMGKKLLLTWCHGDGGDLFSKAEQDTRQTVLNSWVLGERSDLLQLYGYAFWLSVFFLIGIEILRMLKRRQLLTYPFLFALTLLGGILFYLIWEAKAVYSLPFLYIMLLLAEDGAECAKTNALALQKKISRTRSRWAAFALTEACLFLVFMGSFMNLTGTEITMTDHSVIYSSDTESIKGISYKKELALTQEFYTSKPFDTIEVAAKDNLDELAGDVSYQIQLENETGDILFESRILPQDADGSRFIFETEEIVPDGKEKFVLTIQSEDRYDDKISFLERRNFYLDMYEGTLTVNGKARQNDLWIQVYEKFPSPWCSTRVGLLIFGGWYAAICALAAWFYKGERHSVKPG